MSFCLLHQILLNQLEVIIGFVESLRRYRFHRLLAISLVTLCHVAETRLGVGTVLDKCELAELNDASATKAAVSGGAALGRLFSIRDSLVNF